MIRTSMMLAVLLAVVGCKGPVSAPATSGGSEKGSTAQTSPSAQNASDVQPESSRYESRSQRRGNRGVAAAPGTFDFYLLTLSWSPEYCVTHPTATECAAHPAFELHGLWPENSDGTYPENCSNAPGPANPSQYSDIYPDQGLLAHEWSTHGTCSGLAPDAYFQAERKAFDAVKVPAQLNGLTNAISLTPGAILADFSAANPSDLSGDVVLACGNNRLTAIEVCLSKNLTAVSCGSVKTCRANSVRITPPGAMSDQ